MELARIDYTIVPEHLVHTWSPQRKHKLSHLTDKRGSYIGDCSSLITYRKNKQHTKQELSKFLAMHACFITKLETGRTKIITTLSLLKLYSYYGNIVDAEPTDPPPSDKDFIIVTKCWDDFCMYCLDMDEKEAARLVIDENRDLKEFKKVVFI